MKDEPTLGQQLESALAIKNKVRVAFCCTPLWKLKLTRAAQARGLTVSEYVELLILNSNDESLIEQQITEPTSQVAADAPKDAFKLIADASSSLKK